MLPSLTNGFCRLNRRVKDWHGLPRIWQTMIPMLQAGVNIAVTSGKNSDEAQSVSAASEEQSASMHEISDVAGSLAKLATELQNEMQRFKL